MAADRRQRLLIHPAYGRAYTTLLARTPARLGRSVSRMNTAQTAASTATTAPTRKARWNEPKAPAVVWLEAWTVSMTWMPATTPIWVTSCWAALITPSSSGRTSFDADAAVDGVTIPIPTPDKDKAARISTSEGCWPSWVNRSMEAARIRAPTTAERRSPTRTAA